MLHAKIPIKNVNISDMKPYTSSIHSRKAEGKTERGALLLSIPLFTLFIVISLLRAEVVHSSTGIPSESQASAGFLNHASGGSIHFFLPMFLIILFITISFYSLKKQLSRKNSALKLSEEKFRLIFEHSPLGIIHFDNEGVITECNSSFEKIVGTSREKFLGTDLTTLPDIRMVQTVKSVLKGNNGYYEDFYDAVTSDRSAPIRAIMAPLTTPGGKITGGIGIIEDITLWKMSEEKLVQAREAAEKANYTKSIFLANMSHEVRTPLNGILGLLQILSSSLTDHRQHEYVDMAISSGKRLTRLLSDILDLTKIESEQFSLIKEEVRIRDILDCIWDSLSTDCGRKNIRLSSVVSESVPEIILGDELRIRQVVQNLAENSLKFTSEGSITIEADFICSDNDKGKLVLKVKDTGIGIDSDKLADITEPFRQVENTYTRKFQGAGLGLAIVKRLVGLMDGEINIESSPGKGTEVKCTMNVELCEDNRNKGTEEPVDDGAEVQPLRILLVEDDRINSLMIRRLLEKKSHIVTDAANGLEALQCLTEDDFDLVLMDIQMPEMNGIEAVKEIRKTERFGSRSGVCTIALTAYAMAGDREKFLSEGFDEYLPKPVDMEELNSIILRLNPLKKS